MLPIPTLYKQAIRDAPPWFGFVFLLLLYLSPPLNAQVQKGQFHLGGAFSFYNSFSAGGSSFSASLQPETGVMLSQKWSAGLSLPFTYNSSRSSQSSYILGIAPFVRYYVDLKAGFYAIVHLQAGTQYALNSKLIRWDIRATPAISYFFSPRFALEAGLGGFTYTRNQSRFNGQEYFDSKSVLTFRTYPVFSLRYYFPTQASN